MAAALKLLSEAKCFGGWQKRFSHFSNVTNCEMKFAIYLPPQADRGKVPAMWFLSGLTCTDENFTTKAGAQRYAAEKGIAIVAPDTSPRGTNIEGETESWDFGQGAGFYVNATESKWSKNYNMYSYVTEELWNLVNSHFPISGKHSISGHSMGGHGALICALKNPGKYQSVSAFAPICNPIECPWGKKAFSGYLGANNTDLWKSYDATNLIASYKGPELQILIDQGTSDKFFGEKQLLPENFKAAAEKAGFNVNVRMQEGYDHSYYFISSFIGDHIEHHSKYLS